jgi:CBS domain-containing protein
MRARDLAQDLPTVRSEDPALTAARLIASRRLPGIAVVDADGRPLRFYQLAPVIHEVVG